MRSGIASGALDRDVRPQDDLFGFANGGWISRTEIPEDRARHGTFNLLADAAELHLREIVEDDTGKVGDLFASFMDGGRIEALGLTNLAGDLAEIDAVADVGGLLRLLGRLQRESVGGAFAPFVNTDARDSDRYVVYLEQAGLGLPDESYYREEAFAEVRKTYVAHVETMLGLVDTPEAAEAAARVTALETTLAGAHWDLVTSRDAVKTYTKLTFAELQEQTPGVDWAAWLEGFGASGTAFSEVIARQPSYLHAWARALTDVPLQDWKAWLRWHLVHAAAPYLTDAFVDENFAFYGRTLTGAPQLRERWKRGVSLVGAALGEEAAKLYVERHFPPAAKARMVELVDNLIEAYRRRISQLDWMTEQTRQRALDKLAAFRPKIGYPEKWRDYSTLRIERDDLLGNVRRAAEFETDRQLAKLGGPVDRDEWFMTPQTVNAYYNPGMNEIVFPAAILQPPFFDAEADEAVNYGAIGSVIGHEIGHGFDDQGSRYDGAGNLVDWWGQDDRAAFDLRAKALIDQYSGFEPRELPGRTVNGALTVGENIGDLGGVTIAHEAYRIAMDDVEPSVIDGFTGDQRFFVGWARVWQMKAREQEQIRLLAIDPHSPPEFRANVVRNLPEFYAAFDVVEGDGLWLPDSERVAIW
jgi:putative endopeptidase